MHTRSLRVMVLAMYCRPRNELCAGDGTRRPRCGLPGYGDSSGHEQVHAGIRRSADANGVQRRALPRQRTGNRPGRQRNRSPDPVHGQHPQRRHHRHRPSDHRLGDHRAAARRRAERRAARRTSTGCRSRDRSRGRPTGSAISAWRAARVVARWRPSTTAGSRWPTEWSARRVIRVGPCTFPPTTGVPPSSECSTAHGVSSRRRFRGRPWVSRLEGKRLRGRIRKRHRLVRRSSSGMSVRNVEDEVRCPV